MSDINVTDDEVEKCYTELYDCFPVGAKKQDALFNLKRIFCWVYFRYYLTQQRRYNGLERLEKLANPKGKELVFFRAGSGFTFVYEGEYYHGDTIAAALDAYEAAQKGQQ